MINSNFVALMRPQRIPLDHRNLSAMLAKASRLSGYMLHVETDDRGDTVAYLEREPTQAARS